MTIILALHRARLCRFHSALIDALRANGHTVSITWHDAGVGKDVTAIAALLMFEDTLFSPREAPLTTRILPAALAPDIPQDDNLSAGRIIDLSGRGHINRPPGADVWRLTFDGSDQQSALWAALLDSRAPLLRIENSEGTLIAQALPAIEQPNRLGLAADHVLARCIDLVLAALEGPASAMQAVHQPQSSAPVSPIAPARFFAANLAARIVARIGKLAGKRQPQWQVGYRPLNGADDATPVQRTFSWPQQDYRRLPDDGQRYYADPFPVHHQGRHFIFVEEFPFTTGKGILSVAEIGTDGMARTPVPCLETAAHLSYPQAFQHQDQWWMIPESCAANRLDLFRAVEFPWRWEYDRTLIEGAAISDATLMQHDGKWWLLGTVAGQGRSTWDCLHAWHADNLLGPWQPHEKNPLLIDASCARPAGHCFIRDGQLIRPVQNCTKGYGAGLGLAAITRLDEKDFSQTVLQQLSADPRWHAQGVHTLNSNGHFETIDYFA